MKTIGFLFGEEVEFSQRVITAINNRKISGLVAKEIKIGVVTSMDKTEYSVILDRFSARLPFYSTIINFFAQQGAKIINSSNSENYIFNEIFLYVSALKKLKINVSKTAVIPSKCLPHNITGNMLQNLIYPLDWDKLFSGISFPSNIMPNNSSNGFYDCFRVYNQQDFFSIYDMSGENTLVLQETFAENCNYYRTFIVGEKIFILKYDCFQPANSRYSLLENIDKKVETYINSSLKKIRKNYPIDIFIADFVDADKIYLTQINKANINFDNAFLPEKCYDWLVNSTVDLLIQAAGIKDAKSKNTSSATSTSSSTDDILKTTKSTGKSNKKSN